MRVCVCIYHRLPDASPHAPASLASAPKNDDALLLARYRLQLRRRNTRVLLHVSSRHVLAVMEEKIWDSNDRPSPPVFCGMARLEFKDGVHLVSHCTCSKSTLKILDMLDVATSHMVFDARDFPQATCMHTRAYDDDMKHLITSSSSALVDFPVTSLLEWHGRGAVVAKCSGRDLGLVLMVNRSVEKCATCLKRTCGHTRLCASMSTESKYDPDDGGSSSDGAGSDDSTSEEPPDLVSEDDSGDSDSSDSDSDEVRVSVCRRFTFSTSSSFTLVGACVHTQRTRTRARTRTNTHTHTHTRTHTHTHTHTYIHTHIHVHIHTYTYTHTHTHTCVGSQTRTHTTT